MQEQKERREKIRQFILNDAEKRAETVGEEKSIIEGIIGGGQSLVESGLYDSLSFLDLIAAVETEFDIEIDMTGYDLEYLVTLEGLSIIAAEGKSRESVEKEAAIISSKTADGISLEQLTPEHPCWRELLPMFDALYEYLERFNLLVKPKANGAELWLKSLEKVAGKTNIIVGAVDNGRLVGYYHAALKILPIYLEGGYVGALLSMYVLPEYRKQGVAEDMYQAAHDWLVARNVTSLEAQPMFNNQRIIEYWLGHGFEKEITQIRKMIKR